MPNYEITFDEESHIYRVNGVVKESVTQRMRRAGLLGDYDDIPQHYMDRGTRVHDACELVAQGWISSDNVSEDIKVYVRSFESIVFELGLSYVSSEEVCYDHPLYCEHCEAALTEDEVVPIECVDDREAYMCIECGHEVRMGYDYCGKYDLIMMWEGKRTLVEVKTSKVDMFHGIQIAAYERMVEVDDVLGLELKTGYVFGKAPDWSKNHDAWRDINTGFFDLESWKSDRKRRRMKRIL